MNDGSDKKIAGAFRTGIKFAYGKKVWRKLAEFADESGVSRDHFCQTRLKIESSAMSKGLGDGRISLENIIVAAVEIGRPVRWLPRLPSKTILAIRGYQHVLAVYGHIWSIEKFVCVRIVCRLVGRIQSLEQYLKGTSSDALKRSLRLQLDDLTIGINDQINRLIEEYYREYLDELDVSIPVRQRGLDELKQLWEIHGPTAEYFFRKLMDYDWG